MRCKQLPHPNPLPIGEREVRGWRSQVTPPPASSQKAKLSRTLQRIIGPQGPTAGGGVTPFQRKVYEAILKIPKGQVQTYGQVARVIGKPKAARAVGQALKKNRWAPQIPCHRVVASAGLGGYSGGLSRKRQLLRREGALDPATRATASGRGPLLRVVPSKAEGRVEGRRSNFR